MSSFQGEFRNKHFWTKLLKATLTGTIFVRLRTLFIHNTYYLRNLSTLKNCIFQTKQTCFYGY